MIEKLDIAYLKKSYRNGSLTPRSVCEEIIKRAEDTKDMHIWITYPSMHLIEKYLIELKEEDMEKLPLWGIPFAIKDNIDLENVFTTAGCDTYKYIPKESATVVRLLIEAGAIPIGKTNLDQFATGLVGTRSLYGETHNSIKPELISGGSSSGSAVSVAMGQAAFALGTDTAGSGRVPALLNNLIGLKPSIGAWSTRGVVPACESLDCVTVFANSLEDAKLVDDIARCYDKKCSWSKKFSKVEVKLPKAVLIPDKELTFYGPYAEQYKCAWEKFVKNALEIGIPVETVDYSIFSEAASILYDGPWIAERWSSLGEFVEKNDGQAMVPVTEQILKSGNKENLKADSVFKAIHRLAQIKCEVRNLLEDKLLILPTAGGTYTRAEVDEDPIKTNSNMGLYTNHCNLLDLSALAFRTGFADEGVPFGVTAFAMSGNDGLSLGYAEEFEKKMSEDMTRLVVCGLHMRGFAYEEQLKALDAVFEKEAKTTDKYRLYLLPTEPVKPGLVRCEENGCGIDVEVWKMPTRNVGRFLANIPIPLCLGNIELSDGEIVKGFLCEAYAIKEAKDVSEYGSFKVAMELFA